VGLWVDSDWSFLLFVPYQSYARCIDCWHDSFVRSDKKIHEKQKDDMVLGSSSDVVSSFQEKGNCTPDERPHWNK